MSADKPLTLYAFPGLGANKDIFTYLNVNATVVHVPWQQPSAKDDMNSFAKKLIAPFDLKQPYAFIGVSFGGMLVTELHHTYSPVFSVLVSTATTKNEMPFWMRGFRLNPVLWMMPSWFFKPPFFMIKRSLGLKNQRHVAFFKANYSATNSQFLKHSFRIITHWKRKANRCENQLRIHGDRDVLFPVKKLTMPIHVLKGTHFLIISGANSINAIINSHINASVVK